MKYLFQDVMVVGEPSLMGGEFGEEDERLISRLENAQYDPAAQAAQAAAQGPPPPGPPMMDPDGPGGFGGPGGWPPPSGPPPGGPPPPGPLPPVNTPTGGPKMEPDIKKSPKNC